VDSHGDTRELYIVGLSAFGFEATAVGDETEAWERAWELHPEIIVADLPTRDYDCWDLPRHLKEDPRTRDIPVVVLSGYVQQSLRERAEHDGVAAFFSKPCIPAELAAGLHQVLAEQAQPPAP
jgi:CheY-like chemotaxis protein